MKPAVAEAPVAPLGAQGRAPSATFQKAFTDWKKNDLGISPVIMIGLMSTARSHLMINGGWRKEGESVGESLVQSRALITEFFGISSDELNALIALYPVINGPVRIAILLEEAWPGHVPALIQ